MKQLKILLILVVFLLSNTIKAQTNYATASNTKKSPYVVKVPAHHVSKVTEIGFSFWLKASYSSPGLFNFHHLHHGWPSIAGISDSGNNFCGAGRDRFLALWLANAGVQDQMPHYYFATYQKNNHYRNRMMKFPYGKTDFDHSWNFISFTYSFEHHQSTAAVLFGDSKQLKIFYFDHNHKFTPQNLHFRLGSCNDHSDQSFQGYYHDVNFQYSVQQYAGIHIRSEQAFRKYWATRPAPTDIPREVSKLLLSKALTRKSTDSTTHKWNFDKLNGVHDYAVWGWAKWDYTAKKGPWHLLYRFSALNEKNVQSNHKIGDRTLACWVGNGYLHFSTYDFRYYGGHKVNVAKNEYYDNKDLHKWFFVYQGYSHHLRKAVAYVHFAGKDTRIEWNNLWHYLPDQATFFLGKDPSYQGFNGQLDKWNIRFGQEAFRDYYFDDICGPECQNPPDEKYVNLIEPAKPHPKLRAQGMNDKNSQYRFEVPKNDLKNVEDTSYSFWFRWNFFEKKNINLHAFHSQFMPLAMLSETEVDNVAIGDRKQSIWLAPNNQIPRFYAGTYDKVTNNGNKGQYLYFEDPKDLDSSWNFVYFGYCKQTHKLFLYIKFGKSGSTQTLSYTPSHHNYNLNKLVFKLGQSNQFKYGFNGHFWNVRFYYKGLSYLGSKEAVDYYYYQSKSPALYPNYLPYKKFCVFKKERHFTADKKHPLTKGPYTKIEGAEEYAVYGWAKWQWTAHKKPWHLLFRFTNYNPQEYQNIRVGDRDLACWVGNGYLHFAAYNYHISGAIKDPNWAKNINYGGDLEKWFFFYMAYSHKKQKVVMHVKFHSKTHTLFLENVNHFLPFQPYLYVGHDKFHPGFNGWMKNVNIAFGEGAYQESYYDTLH